MRSMLARRRTELAFADAEDLVTLGKCEVQFVIYHYHVILCHPLESGTQSVKAIGNGRIVLDVAVAIKVRCKFLRSLAHKWSLLVLLTISGAGVMRYNEIEKSIPDISSRVLSGTLKTLEQDSLIHRHVYPVVPPKVEYSLTQTGESLMPIVYSLIAWAKENFDTIMLHRKKAGRK